MKNKLNKNPVLFLDRDGTINIDLMNQYVNNPEDANLIKNVGKSIAKAKQAGFLISVITNQAGVAKGITPPNALPMITQRLEKLIAQEAGIAEFSFDDVQICIHHPKENCRCRKPETLLLEQSMKKLDADPARCFFVGDKTSDVQCGHKMGIPGILVRTGHGMETIEKLKQNPINTGVIHIVDSLVEAIDLAISTMAKQ